ncbi:Hypothetical predicted protein [Mytilus galloprovincialis]|uniref:Reverse transcriptase domain-containing protein n=1 Tax=Mytilus galloprovincialis TaxID=29158 RepID=A0A8B6F2F0_MYTGA|nr:Hypothetical predicted protein [Mytilus galloprovincialis]
MEAESSFTDAKDEAVDEWSALLCTQLNGSKNLKEKWSNFKKLTKKNENNLVLPFLDSNGNILFEEEDKEKILEDTFFKGNHLNANNFDNDFYTEIMEKYINITLSEEVEEEGYMNEEISRDELEGSIAKLKKNSAPGPDNIFTELIINAGDSLISTLLHIFNKSIEEGRIPIQWKRANVKFLKKAGKSNYNHPSSYRPISLTSVLGKTMERIITTRVECYVESENILDIEQEGFRHFRSTTNALLNLTQSILDGFNLDNFTLAVLIDFEKAYDSVWREGLLVKLHQYGIKGKIWKWIQAFLNERNKKHPGTVHLVLGNQPIKYNPNPKLLGVTLDEKLTFSEHINIIEKKAGKSLGILREIKGIGVSATASLEVLQVMAGVLPLDLRREEMAIRDIARLNSYSTKIPIRNKIDEWKNKETVDKFISPLGLMLQQAKNMKEETDISIDDIEARISISSQTAIGILTLNWKIENNRSTSHEIISLIKCIQKHHGIRINFDWTPGHADVRGNEIADKLAKEAAKEANQIQKEAHITVTKQDIKTAARILVNKKWQHRWDNSDTGRFYYNFHQTVSNKSTFDYPDHKTAKIIRNLRSGYYLKNYQNKINQNIDPKCECGQLETVEHYLLFCENYEEARQKLIHEIYFNTGSLHIDLELLLSIEKNDNVSVSNETLMRLLGDFICESRRFD